MPVSVRLDFAPPQEDDIVALRILEAPDVDGTYEEIERTTAIGTYPDYISKYTTQKATSASDFFAIQWEFQSGILGEMSPGVPGSEATAVQQLVQRMLLRDPTIDELVATQEAESVLYAYFSEDPYRIDPDTINPTEMSGLTLLAMASTYIFTTATETSTGGTAQKFTAGLVSLDMGSGSSTSSSTQRKLQDLEALIAMANRMLGRSFSLIGILTEIESRPYGYGQIVAADVSRSIVEVQ